VCVSVCVRVCVFVDVYVYVYMFVCMCISVRKCVRVFTTSSNELCSNSLEVYSYENMTTLHRSDFLFSQHNGHNARCHQCLEYKSHGSHTRSRTRGKWVENVVWKNRQD